MLSRTEGIMWTRGGMSSRHDPHRSPDQAPQLPRPTLGTEMISMVAARRSRRDEAGEDIIFQGKIESIYDADDPQGECEKLEEGGVHRLFPTRWEFRSSTSLFNHAHRKCGSIGSHGTAADRGRRGEQPHEIISRSRVRVRVSWA